MKFLLLHNLHKTITVTNLCEELHLINLHIYQIYSQRCIDAVTRSISHIDISDVVCVLLWKQTYSAFLILNCSHFYAASHTHTHTLPSSIFCTLLMLSLFIPPDVWNVRSHIKCVCKSQSNQISLIPGGLSKVVFVCGAFCLCIHNISSLQSCVL